MNRYGEIGKRLLFGLGLFATTALAVPVHAHAQDMRVGGTGAALGTVKVLSVAFAKANAAGAKIALVPNLGSSGGMRALQGGAIDLAVISRPVTPQEQAAGLHAFEYGRSPFVFITNRADTTNLPAMQLADYISGRRPTWSDGQPVRFVLRPKSDVDHAYLASISREIEAALAVAHARPGMIIAATDQDAADEAERLPGSLAASTLALVLAEQRKVNVLPFNGVIPSVKALAAGVYPYSKSLMMVTRGAPSGTVRQFIEFVKSREGRAILEATGHWVISG